MIGYRSYRIIDEKPRWVIVDDNGDIINKNPNKEELKNLEDYKKRPNERYTDRYMLDCLKKFYEETGRIPTSRDLINNPRYPGITAYVKRFKGFDNALKLAGLDISTTAKNGILQDTNRKGRLFEIIVREHFENKPKDLGEKHDSPCDGICPKGKNYDAKSSKLYDGGYYSFNTRNKHREEIEYYYFGAFSKNWEELEYAWRVPGEMVDKDYFVVGMTKNWEHNIHNMKKYDIIDTLKGLYKIKDDKGKCINISIYDANEVTRKKSRTSIHTNTKCCKCGADYTYISPKGYASWFKCICNKENCTKYLCNKCHI